MVNSHERAWSHAENLLRWLSGHMEEVLIFDRCLERMCTWP